MLNFTRESTKDVPEKFQGQLKNIKVTFLF